MPVVRLKITSFVINASAIAKSGGTTDKTPASMLSIKTPNLT